MIHMRPFTPFEFDNQRFLVNRELEFALVQITETGIHKGILDATDPIRNYFKKYQFHDYATQLRGTDGKVTHDAYILTDKKCVKTTVSLYKPATKKRDDPTKGDPRFWIYKYKKYIDANDIHLLFCYEQKLFVIDITKYDIAKCCEANSKSPIKEYIDKATLSIAKVADELLAKFREVEGKWIPAEVNADTGIGRTIETMLGIQMNSLQQPDYKGIELKSFRDKRPGVRKSLFCRVPDWAKSKIKSAVELTAKYGKPTADGRMSLHHTLDCVKPNSYNLRLNVNYKTNYLEIEEDCKINRDEKYSSTNFRKVDDVAIWILDTLHQTLLNKHRETFWVEVESRKNGNLEEFKIVQIEHTKNPIVSQFDVLLEQGKITVDLLLGRSHGGDAVSFKIKKDATSLLFPEHTVYKFK